MTEAFVWRKSSFSDPDGTCVGLAEIDGGIAVCNTNRPEEAPLLLTRDQLTALIAAIKDGEFDHLV